MIKYADVTIPPNFTFLNKKFVLQYNYTKGKLHTVKFNGKEWEKTKTVQENGREVPFFADEDMQEENLIEIDY